jgi:hypothetical protein
MLDLLLSRRCPRERCRKGSVLGPPDLWGVERAYASGHLPLALIGVIAYLVCRRGESGQQPIRPHSVPEMRPLGALEAGIETLTAVIVLARLGTMQTKSAQTTHAHRNS